MIPKHALAVASIILLLHGTPGALASRGLVRHQVGSSTLRFSPMRTAGSYFDALSHHDLRALDRLYAPGVTLTESLTTGQPHVRHGWQIRAFNIESWLSWYLVSSRQLSPSTILTIERPSTPGPGHELAGAQPWLTLFSIKSGKIVSLVWMPC